MWAVTDGGTDFVHDAPKLPLRANPE